MKGVIEMKLTHDEMCQAVYEWLLTRCYEARAKPVRPESVRVNRSGEFVIVFPPKVG
jgi:hypothetical protein